MRKRRPKLRAQSPTAKRAMFFTFAATLKPRSSNHNPPGTPPASVKKAITMKALSIVPLLLLLGCSPPKEAPPPSTTNPKPPPSVLLLWKENKLINNPTEADVRAAVAALDDSEIGPRLRLSLNGNATRIELSGSPQGGFGLDYREGAAQKRRAVYASAKTDLSAETVTQVLVAARNGAPDWKKLLEWTRIKRTPRSANTPQSAVHER